MYLTIVCRGGWDVSAGSDQDETLSSGQFRQVGEKEKNGHPRKWKLSGEEGTKEFSNREWEDSRKWGKLLREREGGEWDLRSGNTWGDQGVNLSDIGHSMVTEESMKEEEFPTWCCSKLRAVNILVTIFAVINLGLVATGCVGFTLCLVEYWSEHLFTSVMVIIIRCILSIITMLLISGRVMCSDVLGNSCYHSGYSGLAGYLSGEEGSHPALASLVGRYLFIIVSGF